MTMTDMGQSLYEFMREVLMYVTIVIYVGRLPSGSMTVLLWRVLTAYPH